jgi:hypothetical protein
MFMSEVLSRAENENVVVGLESSAAGEYLYKSVGFELLERFKGDGTFMGRAGGVMIVSLVEHLL